MKTIIFTFALSLLSCICFIGCKDKDPTKPGYQNKAPKPIFYRFELGEAKSYLWSKPGSYWIYKNTKTNELDTLTCTGFKLDSFTTKGTEDYSKHITIRYDFLKRYLYSSFNKWTYVDETSKYYADGTPFKGLFFAIMKQVYGEGIISAIHYPFDYPAKSGTGSSLTSYIGMDTTLLIQGKTYFNVAKFELDMDELSEKDCQYIPITRYYWAKDVGLIKKMVKNCNYSWELIEHQIIK